MAVMAIGAIASLGAAKMSADASEEGARIQAQAYEDASGITQAAADQAREDVIRTMGPAMGRYTTNLNQARESLMRGDADVMGILQKTAGAADSVLQQGGIDAQKLILGSQAVSRGVPMQQFNQQYQAGQVPGQAPVQAAPGQAPGGPLADQVFAPDVTQVGEPLPDRGGKLATMAPGEIPTGLASTAINTGGVTAPAGTGYYQARGDLGEARDFATGAIQEGRTSALQDLARGEGIYADAETRGLAQTQEFTDLGKSAAQKEAALSGALGPEAQQAAMNEFMESPGQKYLREQQEQSLLRNAAATGGMGGGRVLQELQKQAMGIASTQQQQTMSNLGSIAQRGAATGTAAQQFTGQMGAGQAGMAGAAANVNVGAAQQLAAIESQFGPQIAQLAMQTGMQLSDIQGMTAQQRAQLVSSLGAGMASTRAGTMSDIANTYQSQGEAGLNYEQQKAAMLANIGTTSASQVGQFTADRGSALATGATQAGQTMAQGISSLGALAMYGAGGGQPQWGAQPGQTPTNINPQNLPWTG